jgi:hypothetical protein
MPSGVPRNDDIRGIEVHGGKARFRTMRGGVRYDSGWLPSLEDAKNAREEYYRTLSTEQEANGWYVTGVTADETEDEEAAYRHACEEYDRTVLRFLRQQNQRLRYPDRRAVCIVGVGDQHFGNPGTDVRRAMEEAEIIAETPGMYAVVLGDAIDNYILAKMQHLNFNHTQPVKMQDVLLKRYLRIIGPKLALWVSGNHEGWTQDITGRDPIKAVVGQFAPKALYHTDDCRVTVQVGPHEWPGRIRHKWRGNSIYNLTHAIERAWRFDHDFVWAIGAHTHRSGAVREFNAGGQIGVAALLGSYKTIDTYAIELGVEKANGNTAVALLMDGETGTITGYSNLELAAKIMRSLS